MTFDTLNVYLLSIINAVRTSTDPTQTRFCAVMPCVRDQETMPLDCQIDEKMLVDCGRMHVV